jgi:hypothetical protein
VQVDDHPLLLKQQHFAPNDQIGESMVSESFIRFDALCIDGSEMSIPADQGLNHEASAIG